MTVSKAMRQHRLQGWAKQIAKCRSSGMPVSQWCKENGVGYKSYYYRMRRVREELLDAAESENGLMIHGDQLGALAMPVFAQVPTSRLPDNSAAAATVQIGTYIAEIKNGVDLEAVDGVLRTLSRL